MIYAYDRAGNVLSIQDTTSGTRYFRNQKIDPISTFLYDSLYQLIEASGWQRLDSQNGPQEPVFVSPPDPGQLENYRQTYHYDHSGNLTTLVHSTASHRWTHQMAISRYSNRGLPQRADGSLPGAASMGAVGFAGAVVGYGGSALFGSGMVGRALQSTVRQRAGGCSPKGTTAMVRRDTQLSLPLSSVRRISQTWVVRPR